MSNFPPARHLEAVIKENLQTFSTTLTRDHFLPNLQTSNQSLQRRSKSCSATLNQAEVAIYSVLSFFLFFSFELTWMMFEDISFTPKWPHCCSSAANANLFYLFIYFFICLIKTVVELLKLRYQ